MKTSTQNRCAGMHGAWLALAVAKDIKGPASAVLYAVAIPLAFVREWVSYTIYALVALLWLVPDPRIERKLEG